VVSCPVRALVKALAASSIAREVTLREMGMGWLLSGFAKD
jgi:hypothetical protein